MSDDKKKTKKRPAPHASPARPTWKAPPATFTPSADERLLEMFHATQSVSTRLTLLELQLHRDNEQRRAVALLAGAREVLRAIVRQGPSVPLPRAENVVAGKGLLAAAVPLELLQAAGDLLPALNEFLTGAQR